MDKDVVLEMISTHAVKGRTSKSSKNLRDKYPHSVEISARFILEPQRESVN